MNNVILFNSIYFNKGNIAVIYAIMKSSKAIEKFSLEYDKNGLNIVYSFSQDEAVKEKTTAITSIELYDPPRSISIIDNKEYYKKIHLNIPRNEVIQIDQSDVVDSGKWYPYKI